MLKSARSSAKAVLVAAGAAGFVALGAGVAGADALGPAGATDMLGVAKGTAHMVREEAQSPDPARTLPAPATTNLSTPSGPVSPDAPGKLSAVQDAVADSGHAVDLKSDPDATVDEATKLPLAGGGLTEQLPLKADPLLGKAGKSLPGKSGAEDELGGGLPVVGGVNDKLPETPIKLNGDDVSLPTPPTKESTPSEAGDLGDGKNEEKEARAKAADAQKKAGVTPGQADPARDRVEDTQRTAASKADTPRTAGQRATDSAGSSDVEADSGAAAAGAGKPTDSLSAVTDKTGVGDAADVGSPQLP